MSKYNIYVLIDPISKTIRYVGQTTQSPHKRYIGHKCSSILRKDKSHKGKWLRSLYKQTLSPIIKQIESVNTLEECNKLEEFYIETFRKIGHKLTNHLLGGKNYPGHGVPKTREWADKIGKSNKGKHRTLEQREYISLGRKDCYETKVITPEGISYTFNSFRRACRFTGIDRSVMRRKLSKGINIYKDFYFGSSKSSQTKDETINTLSKEW